MGIDIASQQVFPASWLDVEEGFWAREAGELAGDFAAHLYAAYFLDWPENLEEVLNAGLVLDEIAERIVLYDYGRVKDYFEGPLVDVFELIGCIGVDGVEEVLEWSIAVLEGAALSPAPDKALVEAYSDCTGWSRVPGDPVEVAGMVFLSLVGAYNKTLARIAR